MSAEKYSTAVDDSVVTPTIASCSQRRPRLMYLSTLTRMVARVSLIVLGVFGCIGGLDLAGWG